jgi:hypothetical protein
MTKERHANVFTKVNSTLYICLFTEVNDRCCDEEKK